MEGVAARGATLWRDRCHKPTATTARRRIMTPRRPNRFRWEATSPEDRCSFYGCNEAIAAARERLDELGIVGGVCQSFPQPIHGDVQAVLEIHKGVRRPNCLSKFFPGNQFSRTFQEHL